MAAARSVGSLLGHGLRARRLEDGFDDDIISALSALGYEALRDERNAGRRKFGIREPHFQVLIANAVGEHPDDCQDAFLDVFFAANALVFPDSKDLSAAVVIESSDLSRMDLLDHLKRYYVGSGSFRFLFLHGYCLFLVARGFVFAARRVFASTSSTTAVAAAELVVCCASATPAMYSNNDDSRINRMPRMACG